MSEAEGKNSKGPGEEEGIPTASFPGSGKKAIGQVGPYKLLSVLGEGGCGMVYLAERERPVKRRVALKVIKPGMDSKQVIARFGAEEQALALLDHPNVAQVYEAGMTEAGQSYFAMEYVKGVPITEHCDRQKLSVKGRLKLFLQICDAVGHAHQKGIIHRDIKPSNILVLFERQKALPKVIDFGIAKAISQPLTDRTLFTEHGQLLGTPEYMSPEQAEMTAQDIDTRSDIYSLGVVLYELLTGTLPFDRKTLEKAGFGEIQRIIREHDPPRPSTRLSSLGEEATKIAQSRRMEVASLTKQLHRELEWIPLKAMRKDRTRRYRSASELADDIENYLKGAPLIAGPESAAYRVRKFVRRNRTPVAAAAVVVAAILVGFIVSTMMYLRAESAREKEAAARSHAEEARKVAEVARKSEAQQRQIAKAEANRAKQEAKRAKELAETRRKDLYFNRIALSDIAYRNGDISHVRELLKSCPEDLRGWEWYRLNHISDQAVMTLRGHGRVRGVAVSPDGKYIASGSHDKTIKVCDAATGGELTTLRGHEQGVGPVSFSPDGRRIVSGSGDKTVKLWDWTTGKELMTFRGQHEGYIGGRFSPDGRYVVSWGQDKTIKVWDAASGKELAALRGGVPAGGMSGVAFSPDGKRIVSGNRDEIIRIWDWATGDEPMTLRGHEGGVPSVAFSPDGKQIVSGSHDETIRVWDVESGSETITMFTEAYVRIAAFSPDGKRIVSASGNVIKLWDARTGAELKILRGHEGMIMEAVFSPDGERIISSSLDKTIKVWEPAIERERLTLRGHKNGVISLAFSPDGKRIVSGGRDKTVRVWDAASGAEIMILPGHSDWISSVVFTIDGTRIISNGRDGMVKVWDAVSGAELATFHNPDGEIWSAAPSPDGKTVVFNGDDNNLSIWDLSAEGSVKTLCRHKTWPSCVAFSPDGKYIASGDADGAVKVWDVITGNEVMTLKRNRLWSYIYCMAFSPDGRRIVTGGEEVKVWNVETGNEEMTLQGHGGWTDSVVFSPDGKRIIGGCGNVKVWDASTGAEILSLGGDKISGWIVAISPDGKTIATNDEKNIVLLESVVPADGYKSRRTVQAARKVVEQLYKQLNSYHNVIDSLQLDSTLEVPVRQLALQTAKARLWEDAERLNKESWEVVSLPGKSIEDYQVALEKAETAKSLEPDNWSTLNTLGAAQYRVGSYEDALVTLTNAGKIRADNHLKPDHANVAFRAMALYRLDRTEEAQASIEKLRGLFKEKESRDEKKLRPFLFEAGKLFAGANTKLYSVWEHIEKGDFEKAVQLVEEIRSLSDKEDNEITKRIKGAVKWLGRKCYNRAVRRGAREYAEMIGDYEAVVAIDPEHAGAFNALAWLRVICPVAEFRNGAKAVEEAAQACELTDWKNAMYIGTFAAACSEVGDFAAAVKWQKEAIDLLPAEERPKWEANYQVRLKGYESGKPYTRKEQLVGWWKFDDGSGNKARDFSGNGYNGALNNMDESNWVDGVTGGALKLDGIDDYVSIPALGIYSDSLTISAWIRRDGEHAVTYTGIVYCRDGKTTAGISFGGTANFEVNNELAYNWDDNEQAWGWDSGLIIPDKKWVFICLVVEPTKATLYLGEDETVSSATNTINHRIEDFDGITRIGSDLIGDMRYFKGLIDDVRIYSYALSQEEVGALYAGEERSGGED